jgi:hypothetical protein
MHIPPRPDPEKATRPGRCCFFENNSVCYRVGRLLFFSEFSCLALAMLPTDSQKVILWNLEVGALHKVEATKKSLSMQGADRLNLQGCCQLWR